uniref:Nicastrin n=1 Tax=Panagrellus redivivus TaxID=6233 RepID=A0A7E4W4L4_PANRE
MNSAKQAFFLLCISILNVSIGAFYSNHEFLLKYISRRILHVTALRVQEDIRLCNNESLVPTLFYIEKQNDYLSVESHPIVIMTTSSGYLPTIFKHLHMIKCMCFGSRNELKSMVIPLNDRHEIYTTLAKCMVTEDKYKPTYEDEIDYLGDVIYTMPQNLIAGKSEVRSDACFDKTGQPTSMFPHMTGCILVASSTYNQNDGTRKKTSFYVGPLSHEAISSALPIFGEEVYRYARPYIALMGIPYDIWQQRADYAENATTIADLKQPCRGYMFPHLDPTTKNSDMSYAIFCFFEPNTDIGNQIKKHLSQNHKICPFIGDGGPDDVFHSRCGLYITVANNVNNINVFKHNLNCQAVNDDESVHDCAIMTSSSTVSTAICCDHDHFCNLDKLKKLGEFIKNPVCKIDLVLSEDVTKAMCVIHFVLLRGEVVPINDDGFYELFNDNKTNIVDELNKVEILKGTIKKHRIASVVLGNPKDNKSCEKFEKNSVLLMMALYCGENGCDDVFFNNKDKFKPVMKHVANKLSCEVGTSTYYISDGVKLHNTSATVKKGALACLVTINVDFYQDGEDEKTLYSVKGEVAKLGPNDKCECDMEPPSEAASFKCCWLTMHVKWTFVEIMKKMSEMMATTESIYNTQQSGNYKDYCTRRGFPRLSKYCEPGHYGCYMVKDVGTRHEEKHDSKVFGNCIGTLHERQNSETIAELSHALLCEAEELQDSCTWVHDGERVSEVCCCTTQDLSSNKIYNCKNPVDDLFKNEAVAKFIEEFRDTIKT